MLLEQRRPIKNICFQREYHWVTTSHYNLVAMVTLIQKKDMFFRRAAAKGTATTKWGFPCWCYRCCPREAGSHAERDHPREATTLWCRHPVFPDVIPCILRVHQGFYWRAGQCSTIPGERAVTSATSHLYRSKGYQRSVPGNRQIFPANHPYSSRDYQERGQVSKQLLFAPLVIYPVLKTTKGAGQSIQLRRLP